MGKLFDWFDSRFAVKAPHRRFFERSIPPNLNYTYCFGGIAFTYFLILVLSGLLLSIFYVPSEKEAYKSVVMITNDIPFGWLIRGVHKWSASLFIIFIILHAIRVFVSKAYRPPRELNWVIGTSIFVIAMASGFTGYLLPWDQKAYWATEVGTSMVGTIPLIGKSLMYMIGGGSEVTGTTLIRFFSLHVLFLPLMIGILLWLHFHIVKRQGISTNL
ncbi:MAG: cytochrome b N-terminal domain-containing protein [Thermodesulfovibrionales bacterium]|nr:cytochrome b N-terminal domain-containing protein [Thermodesulfovibrionales bacterium]